ncbi:hypothetical protein ACFL59_03885, partial [Planctomycetota bacterium]
WNPACLFHVCIETLPTEIRLLFADQGQVIDATQTAALFPNATHVMSEIECHPHPKGGNIIRCVLRK